MESIANQPVVIVVDDDPNVSRQLSELMRPHYTVLTTCEPRQALHWIEKNARIFAVIVDQVLRQGLGIELLENAKVLRPTVKRVLLTRFDDLSSIVQALHEGTIHRMISKPLMRGELTAALAHPSGLAQTA